MPALQAGSRLPGRLQAARTTLRAVGTTSMHWTTGSCLRWTRDTSCSPTQRARWTEELRFPRPQILLPDRRLTAALWQQL